MLTSLRLCIHQNQYRWRMLLDKWCFPLDLTPSVFLRQVSFSESGSLGNSSGSDVTSLSSQLPDTPNSMVPSPVDTWGGREVNPREHNGNRVLSRDAQRPAVTLNEERRIKDQDGLCSWIHYSRDWSTGGLTVPFTFRHFSSLFLLKDTSAGDTAVDGHYDGGSSSTGTPWHLHDANGLTGHNVGNMLWDSNACTGRLNVDAHSRPMFIRKIQTVYMCMISKFHYRLL